MKIFCHVLLTSLMFLAPVCAMHIEHQQMDSETFFIFKKLKHGLITTNKAVQLIQEAIEADQNQGNSQLVALFMEKQPLINTTDYTLGGNNYTVLSSKPDYVNSDYIRQNPRSPGFYFLANSVENLSVQVQATVSAETVVPLSLIVVDFENFDPVSQFTPTNQLTNNGITGYYWAQVSRINDKQGLAFVTNQSQDIMSGGFIIYATIPN